MKILLLIAFSFFGYLSFAQCNGFHKENCDLPMDWDYEFNSQSMGTGIFPGQAFRIKVILYEGNDYYLGFCKQEGITNFQFKVQLDNIELDQSSAIEESESLKYIELSIQKTIVAIVEVKLARTQDMNFHVSNLKCLGIIIGNKLTDESY